MMQRHNKKIIGFNIVEVIIIIVISSITAGIATGIITIGNYRTSAGPTYSELLQDDSIKGFLDVYADVVNGYYENVDKDKAINSAIAGMMDYLGDKYTTYLNDEETENLNDMLEGTFNGIGIYIGSDAIIQQVFEDSPAEKAGLQKGDKLIEVKGVSTQDKPLEDITKIIKESKGSIKIKILRNNQEIEKDVEVKELNKPSITYQLLESDNKKVGYIYIDSFTTTVSNQVKKALEKMENEGMNGLIIDIRDNGGGYLTAAENIAEQFIEKGKLIYSLEGKDTKEEFKDQTDEKKNYNVVVLINDGTASASEILAASLKDSYGAKLVGITSYGKGKVQQTKKLSDGTMIKYTTAKWIRPNGECVDEVGITPDYEVDLIKNEDGTIQDTQMIKALEVLFE